MDPFDNYEKFSKASDCITKPKPCKGCKCGRAEGKEVEVKKESSSCGRCYLGDAFRCAGCPYKGLPAFNPGDKIDLTSNAQDAFAVEAEETDFKGKEGAVKLEL